MRKIATTALAAAAASMLGVGALQGVALADDNGGGSGGSGGGQGGDSGQQPSQQSTAGDQNEVYGQQYPYGDGGAGSSSGYGGYGSSSGYGGSSGSGRSSSGLGGLGGGLLGG